MGGKGLFCFQLQVKVHHGEEAKVVCESFACMCVNALPVCLVLTAKRQGQWVPQNWSCHEGAGD